MESGNRTNGITLLPCPFCGSEAFLVSGEEFGENYTEVSCNSCNATVSKLGAEAIEAWNTRTERTCKNKATRLQTFWCDRCDCALEDWMDVGGKLINGLRYCPNCGAKVVDA